MIFAILVAILKQIGLDKSKEGELKPTVQDLYFWLVNTDIKTLCPWQSVRLQNSLKVGVKKTKTYLPNSNDNTLEKIKCVLLLREKTTISSKISVTSRKPVLQTRLSKGTYLWLSEVAGHSPNNYCLCQGKTTRLKGPWSQS